MGSLSRLITFFSSLSTFIFSWTSQAAKPITTFSFQLSALIVCFLLASCGHNGDFFKIEGRFMNFSQGEMYIYSLNGGTSKLDTIKVQDGRFAYETFLSQPTTFSLVFPNFSEQPIFGNAGKTAKIEADATNLKEMKVTGDDDNQLMTGFRLHVAPMSPPDVIKYLKEFVHQNPHSPVSLYLISKYLVKTASPDYTLAEKLLTQMTTAGKKEQEKNQLLLMQVMQLKNQISELAKTELQKRLPEFTINTKDIIIRDSAYLKRTISSEIFKNKVGIINVWASWNYDSQNIQRRLVEIKEENKNKVVLLSFSVDADRKVAKSSLKNDKIKWDNVCDEKIWDSPVLKRLGIGMVPDNIIIDQNGKIVARGLDFDNIKTEVNKLLGEK